MMARYESFFSFLCKSKNTTGRRFDAVHMSWITDPTLPICVGRQDSPIGIRTLVQLRCLTHPSFQFWDVHTPAIKSIAQILYQAVLLAVRLPWLVRKQVEARGY